MVKRFSLDSVPPGSRLYATGLGLYEAEVNGRKLGDEFMLPGCCVYDHHVMYQTFDLDGYLRVGENEIRVRLADGWYMGRFGMDGRREHYGNHYAFLAEMHIGDAVIATDASWLAGKSDVVSDSIYDGRMLETWRSWRTAAGCGFQKRTSFADGAYWQPSAHTDLSTGPEHFAVGKRQIPARFRTEHGGFCAL